MVNGQPIYLQPVGGNKGAYIMPNTITTMPQMQQESQQYPLQLQPKQLLVVPSQPAASSTMSEAAQTQTNFDTITTEIPQDGSS